MADVAKSQGARFVFTKPVTLIYSEGLFKATQYQGKGVEKFGGGFVIEPNSDDLANLKAAINSVAQAAAPGIEWSAFRKPIQTGDKLRDKRKLKKGEKYSGDAEWMVGKIVLTARSQFAPQLATVVPGVKLPVDLSDEALKAKYKKDFFWGALVVPEVMLVWYPAKTDDDKPGVTAYCQQVLATGKGTRMNGGRPAAETFSGYLGHASTVDPTAGDGIDDDEIPL